MTREEIVTNYFIENPEASMIEMESELHISKSTIQRILSSSEIRLMKIPSTGKTIGEQLAFNKMLGKRKGGRTTFERYDAIQNEDGTFNGLNPTSSKTKKEPAKRGDIVKIVLTFVSSGMIISINELTKVLNDEFKPSYVYRALTDPRVEEIFGIDVAADIRKHLEYNQMTFYQKVDGLDLSLLDKIKLSDKQREAFAYRYNDGDIRSADEVAEHFNVSRAAILKLESKVLTVFEKYMESKKVK
jgi:predicted DNA-binding protein YlxM (UPF0122 family)